MLWIHCYKDGRIKDPRTRHLELGPPPLLNCQDLAASHHASALAMFSWLAPVLRSPSGYMASGLPPGRCERHRLVADDDEQA